MKIKTIALMAGLGAVSAATLLGSCSKGDAGAAGQQAPTLQTLTVERSNSTLEKSYPAILRGKTDIAIRPQVTGFITKVHVDEGQHVRKGQVLFTLDQVQFQAAVEQAQAAVNAARTAVTSAQITADNKKHLLDKNIISQSDWQLADNQLASAKAQLANAQAALTSARKNLAYTTVTSPSDGVVGSIPNREGSLASPSSAQPLTTVSDNSEMYAYFSLTEKDLLEMTDGGRRPMAEAVKAMPEVMLTLADGTRYPIEGRVATVSGVLDNSTGSASVRALFANPSGMLRSGNTGQVAIPVQADSAIVIPQKATFELQDLKYVYTLNDSNKTVATAIKVLPENDGKNYVVVSGLNPGDRIVTEGIGTTVRADMVVNPAAPAAEQAPAPAAAN
ncbi:MAG: efflux RND transporter periplasmic adaptor subunit [Bacteroides sp.]|nr:efflux RND transporter periplasmic adaptor subunit [Bacteroides sp.]MCM1095633.1 efflux RND transporter periplasmic adaptor subunit [Terasakiella sp.]